ncbi:MAG: alpha/beta hydrolase [Sorangiineae bacterium]|nr:alpha/beta hydrolase [Polyangiaceae bacterium]MEB2322529.1 alpha/beta hydrolase [Sorangiineae bacterium]
MISWLFLAVSLVGAGFTVNAFLPARRAGPLYLPSFFASWLTIELAAHHLAWQALATGGFVVAGALRAWPGEVGFVITLVSWAGLLALWSEGRRSERAMRRELGPLLSSGARPRVPLWRRVTPFPFRSARVRRTNGVEFARVGGQRLRLDVYEPREPGARRPAVLQIHGGAWILGDKKTQGVPLLTHLAASGWVCFNVNYRLSPAATFPDHLVDLKRALAWIREHAATYGVDPRFIAVTGGSAGGHLTALMALTENEPRYQPGFEEADTSVQAAVPFYGIYDFSPETSRLPRAFYRRVLEPWVMKAFAADEPERFREASPIAHVRADAPPFLVLHGDRDTLAPLAGARRFVDALRARSRAPVRYVELAGAQHAFDVFPSPRSVPVIEGVERFLSATRAAARDAAVESGRQSGEAVRAHEAAAPAA